MNKAYDRVEWDFLEVILRMMGFGETWIDWIMKCVKIVSYYLIINGKPTPRLYPTKGIRQGDLLSFYLFLFVVDVLSRSILKRAQAKVRVGLKLSKFCLELTHLFFLRATSFNCQEIASCI